MTWARRAPAGPEPHRCALPVRQRGPDTVPDGSHGDVWVCDDCAKVWIVGADEDEPGDGLYWRAKVFRVRYWQRRARQIRERRAGRGSGEDVAP